MFTSSVVCMCDGFALDAFLGTRYFKKMYIKKHPLFVTFEGGDGAGKTSLMRALSRSLSQEGFSVCLTREPGGTALGEKIRSLLMKSSMDRWTELFLYEAARVEHVKKVIVPALKNKKIVLCDRFIDSSVAYQGGGRGLPLEEVFHLNHIATHGLYPHCTVFLEVPASKALARVSRKTRFEEEGLEFQKKIKQGFLKAKKRDPKRWLWIQVKNQSVTQLKTYVLEYLKKTFLKKEKKTKK